MAILAQTNPTFQPAMRIIASITNTFPVVVTTTFDHNYITGETLRLNIPRGFGMQQINQQYTDIIVTGATTFTMNIDATGYDAFIIPADNPGHFFTQAQVTPIGEVNQLLRAAVKNVLPSGSRT